MGDLNQDLAPTHYYGSRQNRTALHEALDQAGLVALTAGALDPLRRDSAPRPHLHPDGIEVAAGSFGKMARRERLGSR